MIVRYLTESFTRRFFVTCLNECMFPKVATAAEGIVKDVKVFHVLSPVWVHRYYNMSGSDLHERTMPTRDNEVRFIQLQESNDEYDIDY